MIISLRGTNGSGKSTIVREVMRLYWNRIEIQYPGRRKPTGYVLRPRQVSGRNLFVPGHYEIANGGVDTLPDLPTAYDLIKKHHLLGMNVLYEGKNMSDGVTHILGIMQENKPAIHVALIDEPVKKCVAAVRERGHKIKVETIEKLHAKSRRDCDALEKQGVTVFRGNRAAVLRQVREWLEI